MTQEYGLGSYGRVFGVLALSLLFRTCSTGITNRAINEIARNGYEVSYEPNKATLSVSQNRVKKGSLRRIESIPFLEKSELTLYTRDEMLEELAKKNFLRTIKAY